MLLSFTFTYIIQTIKVFCEALKRFHDLQHLLLLFNQHFHKGKHFPKKLNITGYKAYHVCVRYRRQSRTDYTNMEEIHKVHIA